MTSLADMPQGFDNLAKLGLAAYFCRIVFSAGGRAVSFLCPGRLSGHNKFERRIVVGHTQGGRPGRFGAIGLGGHACLGAVGLANYHGRGDIDHDPGQYDGLVAGQSPPDDGVFFDCPCRDICLSGLRWPWRPGPARRAHGTESAAISFYLCVYAAATIGTFAMLEYLGEPGQASGSIAELAGMGRTRPISAAMMAVFMFSLTGIPPLAGFWGKLLIFGSALKRGCPGQAEMCGFGLWFWRFWAC